MRPMASRPTRAAVAIAYCILNCTVTSASAGLAARRSLLTGNVVADQRRGRLASTWCTLPAASVSHMAESPPRKSALEHLWPLGINVWIAGVILLFVVIRVLGSGTAQNLFKSWTAH